ncbi:MAG: restriction endonuclease subunit S, partial [Hyphomonas sp.]|nr:restriction endonuclease subunit S [Hyphomonas sp.]
MSELAVVNPRYPMKKGCEYPFVEMASVGENFSGILKLESRSLEGSGLSRFKSGDVLFAKITPCPQNGKIAFVNTLPNDFGLGSTEFIVLAPRADVVPRFVYHLACSDPVRGRAAARMEGSTGRQRVPEEVFRKRLLVPIPAPDEQAAIARILDAVDTAMERTRAAVERAREVKRALVQRVFSDGVRNEPVKKTAIGYLPKSWEVVPVNSVVGAFQYGLSVPMQSQGDTPILRMGNIQDGDVLLKDLKYVSLPESELAPYRLKR